MAEADKLARLLLVASNRMNREIMAHFLASQHWIEVQMAADSISEAKAVLSEADPDVILISTNHIDTESIGWLHEVKTQRAKIKVVIITTAEEKEHVVDAIAAGADGYLVASSSSDRLLDAIKSVVSGGFAFDSAITVPLLRKFAKMYPSAGAIRDDKLTELSAREREIVSLVSQGLTNKEIAEATYVSINTVKTHLRRIYQLLGVSSRRELLQRPQLSQGG